MKNLLSLILLWMAALPLTAQLSIGDTAPDFKLLSTDGSEVSLASYGDEVKGYIVVFTCNHCPYSKLYEDRLISLHNNYDIAGYPVIAINPNDPNVQSEDSYELMQKRAADKEFPFQYLMDEGQKVYPQYGATRTPHVFLLDADRVVRYIGAIDDDAKDASAVELPYLENAIASLEAGVDPVPEVTKAIGCTIKVQK